MHNPESGSSGDPLYDRFTPPIDLSDGMPLTIAALHDPALLMVADEAILIIPEADAPVPQLQDYKLINLRAIRNHMQGLGVQFQDREGVFDPYQVLEDARLIDQDFAGMHKLPRGVMILKHGEAASIGQDSTPELGLMDTVSSLHADIAIRDGGITVVDLRSTNGTHLYLSRDDAGRELPSAPESRITDELRDELYSAYVNLCDEHGDFSVKSGDGNLAYFGGLIESADGTKQAIEIIIKKAKDFPGLDPNEEGWKKLIIDRTLSGITARNLLSTSVSGAVYKASQEIQLNEQQARQALRMAAK